MKCKVSTFLILLLAAPLSGFAEQLIPAGSLVSCTVSEPKLSSKTANIGDPVMCKVSHVRAIWTFYASIRQLHGWPL